jgi:hypothetical protein
MIKYIKGLKRRKFCKSLFRPHSGPSMNQNYIMLRPMLPICYMTLTNNKLTTFTDESSGLVAIGQKEGRKYNSKQKDGCLKHRYEFLTFIMLAHRILLNPHLSHAPVLVCCSHLNALYTHAEA